MKLYQGKPNTKSKFKIGQKVIFRVNQQDVIDTATGCFWQFCLLEPYGRNLFYPAVYLKNHTWIAESNIHSAEVLNGAASPSAG